MLDSTGEGSPPLPPEPPASRPWRPSPFVAASLAWHGGVLGRLGRDLWRQRIERQSRLGSSSAEKDGNSNPWRRAATRLLANHLLLSAAGMWPRSQLLGPALVRLDEAALSPASRRFEPAQSDLAQRDLARVVLTFDDGPDPRSTPRVLDLLHEHSARASFFCVGRRVLEHPDLAREIVRRGHRIENHSHHHRHTFSFQVWWPLRREIARAQEAIGATVGRFPRWFRAPAGMRNPFLDPVLASLGLAYAAWTRRGYDAVDGSAPRVLARLERNLAAGDILLLHDAHGATDRTGQPVVLDVLPRLLDRLGSRGLRAVALPDPEGCSVGSR